jgi:hypothetical protein
MAPVDLVLVAAVLGYLAVFVAAVGRLRARHKEVWIALGRPPDPDEGSSLRAEWRAWTFLMFRRVSAMPNDRTLRRMVIATRLLFAVSVAILVWTIHFHSA